MGVQKKDSFLMGSGRRYVVKTDIILIFDPIDRFCIGWTKKTEVAFPVSENSLLKEVQMDPETERWVGSYDSGALEPVLNVSEMILENDVDDRCKKQILKAFPVEKQLKVLIEMLEKAGIPLTDDFLSMSAFIKETRNVNARLKAAYKKTKGSKYLTAKDFMALQDKKNQKGGYEHNGVHDIDKPFDMEDLL